MQGVFNGVPALILYILIAAGTAFLCRRLIRIPDELFRKILHGVLLGILPILLYCFDVWWGAALTAALIAVIAYPIIAWFERFSWFARVTTERKPGEFKASLLLVFGMFIIVFAVCWGWLNDRSLALVSVYAWGIGDAGAALVGKKCGKHYMRFAHADAHKTVEGSAAMLLLSFLSVFIILSFRGGLSISVCIVISLVTAFVSATAELYSKNGNDTVICPLSAMVVLLPMIDLFGGLR